MPTNASMQQNPTDPALELAVVTPHDTNDIFPARGLYVGVGGNVAVIAGGDTAAVTLVGVNAGTILPIRVRRVLATGTTATSIVALY